MNVPEPSYFPLSALVALPPVPNDFSGTNPADIAMSQSRGPLTYNVGPIAHGANSSSP